MELEAPSGPESLRNSVAALLRSPANCRLHLTCACSSPGALVALAPLLQQRRVEALNLVCPLLEDRQGATMRATLTALEAADLGGLSELQLRANERSCHSTLLMAGVVEEALRRLGHLCRPGTRVQLVVTCWTSNTWSPALHQLLEAAERVLGEGAQLPGLLLRSPFVMQLCKAREAVHVRCPQCVPHLAYSLRRATSAYCLPPDTTECRNV